MFECLRLFEVLSGNFLRNSVVYAVQDCSNDPTKSTNISNGNAGTNLLGENTRLVLDTVDEMLKSEH